MSRESREARMQGNREIGNKGKRTKSKEKELSMQKQENGFITIYLALTLSVLLSLILTVVDGARRSAIAVEADCAMDLAVYSVFAEYNRALFEKYHLLFIDSSYEKQQGSLSLVEEHLTEYLRMNLSEGNKAIKTADPTKTFLEDAKILQASYATDENADVLVRQAACYMKAKYGLSYIEALQKEYAQAEKFSLFTRDIDGQRNANQAIIDEAERTGRETGETDEEGNPITEEFELDNPADGVNATRPSGVLLLVTGADTMISSKTITADSYYSHRGVTNKGAGLAGRSAPTAVDTVLFDAYIAACCGNYTDVHEGSGLDYQMEYVIAGKESDEANLKSIVHRLLALREACNVTFLFADASKQAEAASLAASIATAAGVPYLTEPIKISLLFAWAYAESVYDVKQLLLGKRVKLIKEAKDWHYSLQGMLGYAQDVAESSAQQALEDVTQGSNFGLGNVAAMKDGLNYQDYLMLFLMAQSKTQKSARTIDLMEMDVRLTPHNSHFRMDDCLDALSVSAYVGSRYGCSTKVERTFCYQ